MDRILELTYTKNKGNGELPAGGMLLALIHSMAQLRGHRVLELSERVLQESLALQWRLQRQVVKATPQRQHRDVRTGDCPGSASYAGGSPSHSLPGTVRARHMVG